MESMNLINYFDARINFGRKIIAFLSKSITKYITGELVQNLITELNEKIKDHSLKNITARQCYM